MTKPIIETVTFRLRDDANQADFVAAAKDMNAWIKAREGFVHRRLSCGEDGTWNEHIQWKSMSAAKAAAADLTQAPSNAPFLSAIDGPTVQLTYCELEVAIN